MDELCYNKNRDKTECINCLEDLRMIHENKVKLMIKAAIFEKNEHKKAMEMIRYRRRDYVVLHVILSWICAVAMLGLIAGIAVIYMIGRESQIISDLSYLRMIIIIGTVLFVMFSLIYCCIVYWHYVELYEEAKKKIDRYEQILKQLNEFYEE